MSWAATREHLHDFFNFIVTYNILGIYKFIHLCWIGLVPYPIVYSSFYLLMCRTHFQKFELSQLKFGCWYNIKLKSPLGRLQISIFTSETYGRIWLIKEVSKVLLCTWSSIEYFSRWFFQKMRCLIQKKKRIKCGAFYEGLITIIFGEH